MMSILLDIRKHFMMKFRELSV